MIREQIYLSLQICKNRKFLKSFFLKEAYLGKHCSSKTTHFDCVRGGRDDTGPDLFVLANLEKYF